MKDKTYNNPSEAGWGGTRMLSIPSHIYHKICKMEAFDWFMTGNSVQQQNESVAEFLRLNPLFSYDTSTKAIPIMSYPSFVVNKDGSLWDWHTGLPCVSQKKVY